MNTRARAQVESSMKTSFKAVAAAGLLTAAPGCYRHGALLGAVIGTSIVTAAIVSSHPPPPARVVYVPPPRYGYEWQPGYWTRDDDRWVWVDGQWIPRQRGCTWVPTHWVQERDGDWRLVRGHWVATAPTVATAPPAAPPPPVTNGPGPDDADPEPPPPPP